MGDCHPWLQKKIMERVILKLNKLINWELPSVCSGPAVPTVCASWWWYYISKMFSQLNEISFILCIPVLLCSAYSTISNLLEPLVLSCLLLRNVIVSPSWTEHNTLCKTIQVHFPQTSQAFKVWFLVTLSVPFCPLTSNVPFSTVYR